MVVLMGGNNEFIPMKSYNYEIKPMNSYSGV